MSRLDYCKYDLVGDCYDWKNDNCDECNIFKAYCEGARRAKNSIVRCKDCKHYEFADNRAFGMPVKYCDWFGFEDVDDDDFCSRAERRVIE